MPRTASSAHARTIASVQAVTALTNGHYVVSSPQWTGTQARTGAVTWGDGTTGTVGAVSAGNSLVGSTMDDQVGARRRGRAHGPDGHYVVNSPNWNNAGGSYPWRAR